MSEYLEQVETGRIYVATPELKKRNDMRPCDAPEAAAGEGESQVGGDAFDIAKATKDQLEAYALKQFNVDLDKRKTVGELRDEVTALTEKAAAGEGD